jgi:hypothetical protein
MTRGNPETCCKALTKKGQPCRAAATAGGLCFFHANPNKASELGRIGGRSKGKFLANNSEPLPALSSMVAVRDAVDRLISDVYAGTHHPRIAGGLAPLLQLQLRALDATDVEQRIAKLERLTARREKSSKTNRSQSGTQFAAGLTPVSAPAAPAPEKQSEHRLAKVEEPLPAVNRVGGPTNNGAACASDKESKLRLTKVEEPLPTQSREGGPTNHGAAHGSGKESEPRPTKIIEERVPAESRGAAPTNNTAVQDSESESEQRLARVEEPLPVGSEEDRPTNNVAARGLEKESEQRVAKGEEPVPSESREAGPIDPAAVRDLLQQALREAEESFPPEKRGWLGLK